MDRCHSGPEMRAAYTLLAEYYQGARLLEYDSNDDVNHWKKPPYWECHSAELTSDDGTVIASYDQHKLSLFSYSPAVDKVVTFDELQKHLFSDPNRRESICFHFRNQYNHWKPLWGFSISHSNREKLNKNSKYRVNIKAEFDNKQPMVQSDYHHQGNKDDTYLFMGHFDHPAQVNDGLAGCIVSYEIIKRLQGKKTRFSYRAFASVEIVGSAYYLNDLGVDVQKIKEAVFMGFSGIDSPFIYQQSYNKKSLIDRIAIFLIKFYKTTGNQIFNHRELAGNDENLFDSVGYEIPCGTLMRWPFPQYHTDSDSMEITSKSNLEEAIDFGLHIIDIIEKNFYLSLVEPGMPCLSNPDISLYLSPDAVSGTKGNSKKSINQFGCVLLDHEKEYIENNTHLLNQFMQNILRMSDGKHTILEVAEKSNMPFGFVYMYANLLKEKGLVEFCENAV